MIDVRDRLEVGGVAYAGLWAMLVASPRCPQCTLSNLGGLLADMPHWLWPAIFGLHLAGIIAAIVGGSVRLTRATALVGVFLWGTLAGAFAVDGAYLWALVHAGAAVSATAVYILWRSTTHDRK